MKPRKPLPRSTKPIARSPIKRAAKPRSKPDGPPRYYEAPKPAVKVYRDGREVCSETTAGKAEYVRRRRVAWEDQKGICSICHLPVSWEEATSDHKNPRGMGGGSRDDRQENINAVHYRCNSEKGSRRV